MPNLRFITSDRVGVFTSLLLIACIALMIIMNVIVSFQDGIQHPVVDFIPPYSATGRIPFSVVEHSARGWLLTGFILSTIALAVIVLILARLALVANRAGLFSGETGRDLIIAGMGSCLYTASVWITNHGAAELAQQFNLTNWSDHSDAHSALTLNFLLSATLFILGTIVSRGEKLQQDQEGLI